MGIRHGNRAVAHYAFDFRTQATESQWNLFALCEAFMFSLADYIKDEMVSYELPTTLDGIIELATLIDLRVCHRTRERRRESTGRLRAL